MQSTRSFVAVALIATLAACGTTMISPQTGFLSDYSALSQSADAASASRATSVAIDPQQLTLSVIDWRVAAAAGITSEEREGLQTQLRAELMQRVQALPAAPGGRPVTLRAAITRVETVSPALNALSAVLLIVPLDRGGAAVEIEAIDAETGRQLAALKLGYFAPLSDLKARFSRLAPAEIALRKAAADFQPLLQAPADAVAKTALR